MRNYEQCQYCGREYGRNWMKQRGARWFCSVRHEILWCILHGEQYEPPSPQPPPRERDSSPD